MYNSYYSYLIDILLNSSAIIAYWVQHKRRLVSHHPPQPYMEKNHPTPQGQEQPLHGPHWVRPAIQRCHLDDDKALRKQLDSAYNRLHYALNISRKDKKNNKSNFGDDIIIVSKRLRQNAWPMPSI